MKPPIRTAAALGAALGALLVGLSGCAMLSVPPAQDDRTLTLPEARPSLLIVITDPGSPLAMRESASLIAATARTGERVVILDDHSGTTLAASTAPPPPAIQVPAPPSPLPQQPTSFQKARYATALHHDELAVQHGRATLGALRQTELATWASRTIASARTHTTEQDTDIAASLGAAAADLSSLRQIGIGDDTGAVIAIVGIDGTAAQSAPIPPSGLQGGLQGATIVVDDFPGGSSAEGAWQASLLQAGAGRVMLLTPATDDRFTLLVGEALDGAITDTLTNVLFGLGEYKLSNAALPQLRKLLRQLTVQYPNATATVIGYTDDLPTPGGNLRLSQLRAQAVTDWLIAHGVAAGRLQSFGDGDSDPIAPNTPAGQPLDRRVDVIIDPALP